MSPIACMLCLWNTLIEHYQAVINIVPMTRRIYLQSSYLAGTVCPASSIPECPRIVFHLPLYPPTPPSPFLLSPTYPLTILSAYQQKVFEKPKIKQGTISQVNSITYIFNRLLSALNIKT